MAPACSKCPTGVGTGDHQCRGSPQPMSRARRFRPRARGGLACLLLGLLVVVDVLPRAEAVYSCTSDGDCAYEGCNDVSCSSSSSYCNNGVWDAYCYDLGGSTGKACYGYTFNPPLFGYYARYGCPDPPAGWPPTTTQTPAMTTPEPSIKCVPVEIEKIVYINQTVEVEKVIEVPVEVEKIVYINQTIEVEKVIEVQVAKMMTKMSKTLSMLKSNITEMKQCACAGGSPSSPTTSWDHMKSPTWTPSSNDIPAWNQSQYKHCQPVFNSWQDLRKGFQAGSLMARTGGLGNLLILNEYESWICVLNDLCSLGGDFYFCYVFQETTGKFVAWDQHYNLNLFQSGNLK